MAETEEGPADCGAEIRTGSGGVGIESPCGSRLVAGAKALVFEVDEQAID